MPTYSVFGGSLRSEIDLPELRLAQNDARQATWTLRIAANGHPLDAATLLGMDDVMSGVTVRLYRLSTEQGDAFRLTYDDTGSFTVSGDGSEIVWSQGAGAWIGAAQLDVINRVLPIALHAAGMFCLHGSAVSINGQGIAFLAPRYYGKSTMAMAMTDAGARILADDVVAIAPEAPITVFPGVHSVRLLDDSANAVVGDSQRLEAMGAYPMPRRDQQAGLTKQILRALPDERLMWDPVPLAAVYLLSPAPAESGRIASRARLGAVRAAMSLVEHTKTGALLGKSAAPALFERAVCVARHVPVYQLTLVRDLARIDEVVEQVACWHRV